uniref:Uncharacterized protein n=1 Tax=Anguilla anguilla TaxID=7936 RepID=A0A0E9XNS9_ANGAN
MKFPSVLLSAHILDNLTASTATHAYYGMLNISVLQWGQEKACWRVHTQIRSAGSRPCHSKWDSHKSISNLSSLDRKRRMIHVLH